MGRTVWAVIILVAAAGCGDNGPKRYEVSGTVTCDGAPLAKGDIMFTSPGQAPDAGRIVDGKFSVMVQPGKKSVEIRASHKVGENEMGDIMEQYLPERYNSKTQLEATIKDGPETLTFDLTSQ